MISPLSSEDRLFILTGAGISAESGLPTFRGVNGLWRGYRVEDVASPQAFYSTPELVWQFYSERRKRHKTVQSNPAHLALAELERALGDHFFLCTQNVDSLHEQAGSQRVVHMHGRLMQSRCSDPDCKSRPFEDSSEYASPLDIPRCTVCAAIVRPHICWFGEVPFDMPLILDHLKAATVLLTVGTSGVVEPAASFARLARHHHIRSIYVGPEEPANASSFDEILLGRAGEVLPRLVPALIA